MRILIVEDEEVSREKLKILLSVYGECEVAENGSPALEMFYHAHRAKQPYELVTMDISMPDMNGHECVGKIREWEKVQNAVRCKILMVTVASDVKTVMSSIKLGCDGYIIKPFDADKIGQVMQQAGVASRLKYKSY